MEFPLILRALKRHKLTVSILLLQFAITFSLLSNTSLVIWQRFAALRTLSGIQEDGLLVATVNYGSGDLLVSHAAQFKRAQTLLASIKGVRNVGVMSQTPFSGEERIRGRISASSIAGGPGYEIAAYFAGPSSLDVLKLRLIAGRWFTRDEFSHPSDMPDAAALHLVIVTEHLARRLYPDGSALGRTAYSRNRPMTIVGIVQHLARPTYQGDATDDAAIFPVEPPPMLQNQIIIRLDSAATPVVRNAESSVRSAVADLSVDGISWKVRSFEQQRSDFFASDRAAFGMLLFILFALILVATNAIAGLSYYWVNQRAQHVATRRALGVMQRQVVAYFLFENICLCVAGVALGLVLTLSVNTWLMLHFGATRIPLMPIVIGFTVAAVIGQLAVAYPAWQIGRMSPALASRI
jgi:putative ABC transport system permease protein